MRLLCVEDEKPLREDIAEYLRMQSHEVDEAASGMEALARMAEQQYDVVLCDIKMPQMDGFEVLRQVRRDNKEAITPFVFLSALTDRDDKLRANEWGCDAYLTKPVDFAVLNATLRAQDARRRATHYMFTSSQQAHRSHMMAMLDTLLRDPLTESSLLIQYLREVGSTLPEEKRAEYYVQLQEQINRMAISCDMALNSLWMQAYALPLIAGDAPVEEVLERLKASVAPGSLIIQRHGEMLEAGSVMRGHIRRIEQALGSLILAGDPKEETPVTLTCEIAPSEKIFTVADFAASHAEHADMFFTIDERTDLASLSVVTRQRVVPLMFASEVARHHGGTLQISLWEQQGLCARLILPQPSPLLQ